MKELKKSIWIILLSFTYLSFFLLAMPKAAVAAATVATGDIGNGLGWFLDDEGQLDVYQNSQGGSGVIPRQFFEAPSFTYYNDVKTLKLERGVVSIEDAAFKGLINLSSISMPITVSKIGDSAFEGCTSLNGLYVPAGELSILGGSAFKGCTGLKSVNVANSKITTIASAAFMGCTNLEGISLPSGLTTIGTGAFCNCSSLKSFPDLPNVTTIGSSAFRACSNLAAINISEKTTEIGEAAFYECRDLASIYIPKSVTTIGRTAFNSCSSLRKMTIRGNLTSIGEMAFPDAEVGTDYYLIKNSLSDTYCTTKYSADYCASHVYYIHEHEGLTAHTAKEATCTESGNSAYWTCSTCGEYFSDENGITKITENDYMIPAAGHSWDGGSITTVPTETTTGVMTYTCTKCSATRTEEIPATLTSYEVKITAGEHMTKTEESGTATQTVTCGSVMTSVVYAAAPGYYFPMDYSVSGVNGVEVKRDSFTQITIYGTPTSNTEITLAAPAVKLPEQTPNASFLATGEESGTLSGTADGMKYSVTGGNSWVEITGESVEIASGITPENGIRVYKPGNGQTTTDSAVQSITITKAAKPTTPAGTDCTNLQNNNGVISGVTTGMEYKKQGDGLWIAGDGNDITSLVSGTYYVRVHAAGAVLASEALEITIHDFIAAQEVTPNAELQATGPDCGILTGVADGMKYSVDGGNSWVEITGESVEIASGITTENGIRVYKPGNGQTTTDSAVQSITITKAAKPTTPAGTDCTNLQNNDGMINGVTADMEYKESGKEAWSDITGSSITGLKPGSYDVRIKASGYVLASDTQEIVIQAYTPTQETTPNAVFTATGADCGTLAKVTSGMQYSIDGGNAWIEVTGDSVTIDSGITAAKKIMVYRAGNGTTTTDSNIQTVNVQEAEKPTGLSGVNCTNTGNNDGKITGTMATMEYRKSDAQAWTDAAENAITGLTSGNYLVRVKAAGYTLASEALTLTIAAYTEQNQNQQNQNQPDQNQQNQNQQNQNQQNQNQPDPNQQNQNQPDPNQQNQNRPDPNQQNQNRPDPNQPDPNQQNQNQQNSNLQNNKPQNNGKDGKEPVSAKEKAAAKFALEKAFHVTCKGNKVNVYWGKVSGINKYEVYAQYCHKSGFEKVGTVAGTSFSFKKLGGKNLNLKKTIMVYVVGLRSGTKLVKTQTAHIALSKNKKFTNIKKIKGTSKIRLKLKKSRKIKIKVKLEKKGRRELPARKHKSQRFRYLSTNKSVATVDNKGKVKAVGKGSCEIWIYAMNGVSKKVSVVVQ